MKYLKSKANMISYLFIFIIGFVFSCTQTEKVTDIEEVFTDQKFNNLFAPDSGGVTGADGAFSIPLSKGQSVFLMGDCFLGNVVDNKRDMETKMLNNSFIVINENQDKARAIFEGTYDNPFSIIEPQNQDDTIRWYWPGHGFTEDSILYIFALNMYNDPSMLVKSDKNESEMDQADRMTEAMWAFKVYGVDLLSFQLPGFEQLSANRVEYAYNTDIHFGNSVFTEGKYIYLMGTKNYSDRAKIHVARTELGRVPYFTDWEFHNGKEWVYDYKQSRPLDIDISVSEQFSVFKIKDKYVLLVQERGTDNIYTYTSTAPQIGYSSKQFIYKAPERENGIDGLFTYNAMAHPQYIENNLLLVSYCVNGPVREIYNDVNNYRVRFVRVPLAMIDTTFAM